MRYVMVPVPSEHVAEVMRWVLFRIPEEDTESSVRDRARLIKLMENADDLTRELLLLVAKATSDGTAPVRLTDAADELGQSVQAIRSALSGLNNPARHESVRKLMMVSEETAIGVHGKKGKVSFLAMRPEDARIVRTAAKTVAAQEDPR